MSINDAHLEDLGMLQLSDSFFPSGLYTTSSGLEALYYSTRKITKADDLYDLIKVYLEHQIGPADCTAGRRVPSPRLVLWRHGGI